MSQLKLEEFSDRMVKLALKLRCELARYENNTLTHRDITATQLLVLEKLSKSGQCKMNILVEALKVKFSGVTALIDRLVKTGFVVREHGLEDRRTVFVSLTPKGKKILDEVYAQRRKAFMQVFGRVSSREREEYLKVLEQIVQTFSDNSLQKSTAWSSASRPKLIAAI